MARLKTTDKRAENNRNRVRRYRYIRKLKAIHEKRIYEEIYSNTIADEIPLTSNIQSDNCCDDKASDVSNKLIEWAMHHHITKAATSDLLKILNYAGLTFLPKDSRTLLKTPVHVPITNLSNGQLWYNGIENCLTNIFRGLDRNISVTLDFNFDGLPIYKSSNEQFWPILSSMRGMCIYKLAVLFAFI